MRIMKLKNSFSGADFFEICGAEAVKNAGSFETQYDAFRKTAALTDFSFTRRFVFDEADGLDFLDALLAENILKLRYGKIINTFLARPNGDIAAECFVANIDDKVYVSAECVGDPAYITECFLGGCASAREITDETVSLSIDGPLAWKVVKDVFGADVLNLSYLSVEAYGYSSEKVALMRSGKTGEYGYQVMAPLAVAEKLFADLKAALDSVGGTLCGTQAHFNARLEGNFFNIYAEGETVKDPLKLGLQWMIDFDKETFKGSEEIFKRRAEGCAQTLVGCRAKNSGKKLELGGGIFMGEEKVAEIVACGRSKILDSDLALALFDKQLGLAGFEFSSAAGGEPDILTLSMPPIIALSLQNGFDA